MDNLRNLLPLVNIVLLAALAVSAVRLLIGAPTLRERLGWGSVAAAAAYGAANWLYLFATLGMEAFNLPQGNLIRWVVLGAGVVTLNTLAPTLRRQRAADRERAEAEERFRRTMDGSTEPMALVGPDGRYRYANPASQALFRYPPTEVIGRHYSEFLIDATEAGANLQRALTSPFGRAAVQRRVRRGDGSEVVVEIEMIGLGDGNVLFVGHDVTERVELAERLERERQRLRLAQEISQVGSVEIDLVTGERWWSDEMFRLLGFEPAAEPPSYNLIWARMHPDDLALVRETTENTAQGTGHTPFTFRLLLPDGTIRHLLQHTHIEHDADGTAVRAARVVVDVTVVQAAQAELERERLRLQLAQVVSQVGSSETNLLTGERWWSPEMFRLFGMEPADQPPPFEVARQRVHPEDRAISEQATRDTLLGKEHEPATYRLVMPDGRIRYVLTQAHVERTEAGVPAVVTRITIDITQIRALEADLERERIRLRFAQQISHVGSSETNLLTGERWWSAEMYDLFGMEPTEEPPSFEVARLHVHPDDRAITEQATRDILNGQEHAPITYRIVLPDGRIRHLLMHARMRRSDSGEPAVVTRVAIDITQLRALEDDLERERIRLRYAQEVSHVGSGEWNLQTDVTWWSAEMFRLLGFEPGSVEPSRDLFLARMHPEDRSIHQDAVARLIAGASVAPQVLRISLPDGTTRSALCQLRMERDQDGTPHLITGVLADVTDFLALQDQLGQAKRLEAIGTLTAGIAHDFNNLLTVIGGSIELAEMGDVQRLAQADQAVQRATGLIRQLMQFSRPRADHMRNDSATLVDLRSIAQEAAEALAADPVGPVSLDLPRQTVIATVDPTRIHRVLMNLLVNARDAVQDAIALAEAPFRPEIRLRLRPAEATPERPAGAEFEVRDNGAGMPPEVRDRVFEPFFTTKEPERGTGLGLATVYGIVRDMGGTIDLTSQPGEGTTFRIWMPLTPPTTPSAEGRSPGGGRILVLDDQADLVEFATEALGNAGLAVTTATSSEQALALLRESTYDLAVIDAFVDDTPLPSLLVQIRQLHPDQRVLVCSGAASRAQAIAWGADEYLAKPFTADALVRMVRGILGLGREAEEAALPR